MGKELNISKLIESVSGDPEVMVVASRVLKGERISIDETVLLYEKAGLGLLGVLSNYVSTVKNGNRVFYNKNFHIEPTNLCVHSCKFCSYKREQGQEGSWVLTLEDIKNLAKTYKSNAATEVHITGGVHPDWDIEFYGKIVETVKSVLPSIHVKAFSAVELDYVIAKAGLTLREGVRLLKNHGLGSIPGGGAEIADERIRREMCNSKTTWKRWLEIHEAAHNEGVHSNATMLYGHIENYRHRAEHMDAVRQLQDKTGGFNCFIPLKFKASNNKMSLIGEVNTLHDLRNFAVTRIFFDNIQHIKAYWPMLGKDVAALSLHFGANDLDGTIDDSTKIYSMAGAQEQSPTMTVEEICTLIRTADKVPVERDSLYNQLK